MIKNHRHFMHHLTNPKWAEALMTPHQLMKKLDMPKFLFCLPNTRLAKPLDLDMPNLMICHEKLDLPQLLI